MSIEPIKKNHTTISIQNTLSIAFIACILIVPSISSTSIQPSYIVEREKEILDSNMMNADYQLDNAFVYNLTYALSQIIFTAYDHENEIPKGRYFGSKGENKAAEILAENMSAIGLFTTVEKIQPRPNIQNDDIAELIEVLEYDITINGATIDCYPAPSWIHPNAQPKDMNTTIDFKNLEFKQLPLHPFVIDQTYAEAENDFVFIIQDQWNDPNWSLPIVGLTKPFLDPLKSYMLFHTTSLLRIMYQTQFFVKNYPKCKGYVLYDFNDHCYDMIYFGGSFKNYLPTIFINGSIGKPIWKHPEEYTMGIHLKQQYNTSVESYNVIGQINGTDPSKTIIVSSLYDCWWNQGTADSAIGMAIVVGIAKYFIDHNITPTYTMKFIAFSGEETEFRGSDYYEALHTDEEILYVVDLNQLGFTQNEPRLTFDIVANKLGFLNDIYEIALKTNYVKRTSDGTDITKIWMHGIPSNPLSFTLNRPNCKCVSFFKDGGWILHHRNGQNYTEGDVFKYYNKTDVAITGELILNVTKFIATDQPIEDGQRVSITSNWFIEKGRNKVFKNLLPSKFMSEPI